MPHFYKIKKPHFLLMAYFLFLLISSYNCLLSKDINNNIDKAFSLIKNNFSPKEKNNNFLRQLSYTCATTSYSKSDIKEECDDGPSSYERILKHLTFSNYISSHSYHSNGLYYVTSLFVDEETHHFGNFMNDGVGMIILYIIDGLILLGWIPLICCWRKRCCLFDDCIYENDCCIIFIIFLPIF